MHIETVRLNGGEELSPTLFNVIIGGNAVGKTTFLIELFEKICEVNRPRWYWVDSLQFKSADIRSDMSLMFQSMVRHYEGSNLFYYSQASRKPEGNVDADNRLRFTVGEYSQLKQNSEMETKESQLTDDLFNQLKYRRPFVTLLDCETRLNLQSSTEVIRLDQLPPNSLNVLFRNRGLLKEISDSIKSQYNIELNLLPHKVSMIDLGFSRGSAPTFDFNSDNLQDECAKIEAWKLDNFTSVRDIGHGIRSMLRILISLFEPVNQVFLIDEPEMHLYPSQKRWIGRQLTKLAKSQQKQVFVVTHDPMVLQGILDTRGATTIFRMDQDDDGKRYIKRCLLENIPDIGAIRNQDSYLQGLFYQRCVVVEGASDRAFYQALVEENYPGVTDKDLGFVACGGSGSSKHVAHIASHVGLRCAFIYDYDALLGNLEVTKKVCIMFGGDGSKLHEIKILLDNLDSLGEHKKELIKESKEKGVASRLVQDNRDVFDRAICALNNSGIFIVPYGDLESWAPDIEGPKARFADNAPDVIKSTPELMARFNKFIKPILEYLGC
ncbi:MAG: ATP-binding protein [Dehalococcoidia bacterium]|nr:ATP-binding protein [Dehalococcoidia bacterium]